MYPLFSGVTSICGDSMVWRQEKGRSGRIYQRKLFKYKTRNDGTMDDLPSRRDTMRLACLSNALDPPPGSKMRCRKVVRTAVLDDCMRLPTGSTSLIV